MEPFGKFNHFIAYFLPGIVLFFTVLAILSLVSGLNVLKANLILENSIFLTIVLASILGLLLDAVRHNYIDSWIERRWSNKEEQEKIDDFMIKDWQRYDYFLNENFYYFEFGFNLLLVLLINVLILPIYLVSFYSFSKIYAFLIILFMVLFIFVLRKFSEDAYTDFNSCCIEALKELKK